MRITELGGPDFSLVLFSADPDFIRRAVAAGIDSIILDWESIGKARRQAGADTEINRHSQEDLRRVRAATSAHVLCRINGVGPSTEAEVASAVEEGADEILVPMVRNVAEVETVLDFARGRCRLGILVETVSAVACAGELARLPLSRVYVGLNDLSIERGTSLFAAVADGTLERIRAAFECPFGFGGLTMPNAGFPVPCRLLIGEMARLRSSFSFLRRSFHRDIADRDLAAEVPRLRGALAAARARTEAEVDRDRADLIAAIHSAASAAPGR